MKILGTFPDERYPSESLFILEVSARELGPMLGEGSAHGEILAKDCHSKSKTVKAYQLKAGDVVEEDSIIERGVESKGIRDAMDDFKKAEKTVRSALSRFINLIPKEEGSEK